MNFIASQWSLFLILVACGKVCNYQSKESLEEMFQTADGDTGLHIAQDVYGLVNIQKREAGCGGSCWSEWSQWTKCSASCGTGHEIRSRVCNHGSKRTKREGMCKGKDSDVKSCLRYYCNQNKNLTNKELHAMGKDAARKNLKRKNELERHRPLTELERDDELMKDTGMSNLDRYRLEEARKKNKTKKVPQEKFRMRLIKEHDKKANDVANKVINKIKQSDVKNIKAEQNAMEDKLYAILKILNGMTIHPNEVNNHEKPQRAGVRTSAVSCHYTVWSQWSNCSTTCGDGVRYRRKACRSEEGKKCIGCTGDSEEAMRCVSGERISHEAMCAKKEEMMNKEIAEAELEREQRRKFGKRSVGRDASDQRTEASMDTDTDYPLVFSVVILTIGVVFVLLIAVLVLNAQHLFKRQSKIFPLNEEQRVSKQIEHS